jgi:hypothetical protein
MFEAEEEAGEVHVELGAPIGKVQRGQGPGRRNVADAVERALEASESRHYRAHRRRDLGFDGCVRLEEVGLRGP